MADSDDKSKDKNQDNAQNKTKQQSIKPGILKPFGAGISAVREFFVYRGQTTRSNIEEKPAVSYTTSSTNETKGKDPRKDPSKDPKLEDPTSQATEKTTEQSTEQTTDLEFNTSVFLELAALPNTDKKEEKIMQEIKQKFEPMLTQHKESVKSKPTLGKKSPSKHRKKR